MLVTIASSNSPSSNSGLRLYILLELGKKERNINFPTKENAIIGRREQLGVLKSDISPFLLLMKI